MEQRITDLTSELVEIPTHETDRKAQELIASALDACGFRCELREIAPSRANLIAQRGANGPFLSSHVDVHPPHDHPDPFTCLRRDEFLVGRGVLDAKGQIAALVAAAEAEPEAPALIAITSDEEGGGLGSDTLELPDGHWRFHGGIVLEPTEFRICTAQAGHIDVHIDVSGVPGHAYAAERSGSPISAVLAAADALETCAFLDDRHPLLPAPQVQIARIDAGEHLWRRPAWAHLEIGTGVVPTTDLETAKAEVCSRLDDVARRWGARGTSFGYKIVDASPGIEVPSDLPVAAELAQAAGVPLERAGMPSWTDAGNLLTKHDLPCVVFGAGSLAPAHSDDEWVRLSDLVRLAETLRRLLSRNRTAR